MDVITLCNQNIVSLIAFSSNLYFQHLSCMQRLLKFNFNSRKIQLMNIEMSDCRIECQIVSSVPNRLLQTLRLNGPETWYSIPVISPFPLIIFVLVVVVVVLWSSSRLSKVKLESFFDDYILCNVPCYDGINISSRSTTWCNI